MTPKSGFKTAQKVDQKWDQKRGPQKGGPREAQEPPKGGQEPPRRGPRETKREPGGSQEGPRRAKESPREPHRSQGRPKGAPERPRESQEKAKERGPREHLGASPPEESPFSVFSSWQVAENGVYVVKAWGFKRASANPKKNLKKGGSDLRDFR